MTKKCEHCENSFEAVRSTAKYCSPKCRKLAFQQDENAKELGNAKNGNCIPIDKPMDCYSCQRRDRDLIAEGKEPLGCQCQWYWGWPACTQLLREYACDSGAQIGGGAQF